MKGAGWEEDGQVAGTKQGAAGSVSAMQLSTPNIVICCTKKRPMGLCTTHASTILNTCPAHTGSVPPARPVPLSPIPQCLHALVTPG